jgi:hypothetical protein
MSTHVNISNSWPGSWKQDHPIEKKNYKPQFLTNSILNDEIFKKNLKDTKPKIANKKMRIKFDTKTK